MLRVPEQSVPVVSSSLPWAERAWCRQLPPVLQQGLALPMAGSSLWKSCSALVLLLELELGVWNSSVSRL